MHSMLVTTEELDAMLSPLRLKHEITLSVEEGGDDLDSPHPGSSKRPLSAAAASQEAKAYRGPAARLHATGELEQSWRPFSSSCYRSSV